MAIPKVTPTQAELDSTKPGGKHRPDKHGKKHRHKNRHGHKNGHGHKRRKHKKRKHHKRKHHRHLLPSMPPAASAPAASSPTSAPTGEQRPAGSFAGAFGVPQAIRLLSRAGFGPTPGQAAAVASMGMVAAVQSLTRPSGAANLIGPPPTDDEGAPLAPADIWGHDHLWSSGWRWSSTTGSRPPKEVCRKPTEPGENTSASVSVEPGRYRMWCDLFSHAKEGMEATITVE